MKRVKCLEMESINMKTLGGKKTCKYYNACGNKENCKKCKAYTKENKKDDKGRL